MLSDRSGQLTVGVDGWIEVDTRGASHTEFLGRHLLQWRSLLGHWRCCRAEAVLQGYCAA
jgi:hypothetical protein